MPSGMQILAQPDPQRRRCPKCRAALLHSSIDRHHPNARLMEVIDVLAQQQRAQAKPAHTSHDAAPASAAHVICERVPSVSGRECWPGHVPSASEASAKDIVAAKHAHAAALLAEEAHKLKAGRQLQEVCKSADALPLLRDALAAHTRLHGDVHPDTAVCQHKVGQALSNLHRYAEALPHFEEALRVRRALPDVDHLDVASSAHCVGYTLIMLGRYSDALAHREQAPRLRKAQLPAHHLDFAGSENNVGVALMKLGRHADALPHCAEALRVRKALMSADCLVIVTSERNVGVALSELGRHAEALPHCREALRICKARLPAGDARITQCELTVRAARYG